jgi:Flp pilus assembly protein TadD
MLDSKFRGAYVNLADAYRQVGRDDEGEKQLRKGLSLIPNAADLHHALGLLLVRKGDKSTALLEFAKASKLAPDDARYAYVYGIALNSISKQREAVSAMKAADTHNPNNLQLLSALISILRESGDNKAALVYARKVSEVLLDNEEIKQLIVELEREK